MTNAMHLPVLDDPEGARVPDRTLTAGDVVDAHVHLFPPRVFEAIWRWFDENAWKIRYRLHADEVVELLTSRGVSQIVALLYAHKPDMARSLNRFAHEIGRAHRDVVVPLGTVFPGEPDAVEIVREALGPLGLHGLKLHCHVQKIAADDPRIDPVYAACADAGKPIVIHAGRAPASPAYGVDTYALCHVSQIERVLRRHPKLTLVVPHLGADEFDAYFALLDRYENLYLDTAMAVADYLPGSAATETVVRYADRLIYGTDFPGLPYAWDRELRRLVDMPLATESRRRLFAGNARRVFCGG